VKRLAIRLLQDFPVAVDPLVARWLGRSEQYGQA